MDQKRRRKVKVPDARACVLLRRSFMNLWAGATFISKTMRAHVGAGEKDHGQSARDLSRFCVVYAHLSEKRLGPCTWSVMLPLLGGTKG